MRTTRRLIWSTANSLTMKPDRMNKQKMELRADMYIMNG